MSQICWCNWGTSSPIHPKVETMSHEPRQVDPDLGTRWVSGGRKHRLSFGAGIQATEARLVRIQPWRNWVIDKTCDLKNKMRVNKKAAWNLGFLLLKHQVLCSFCVPSLCTKRHMSQRPKHNVHLLVPRVTNAIVLLHNASFQKPPK